jgi:hypothetical protein
MTFHTALGFAPIQYTALVGTTLVGYTLNGAQDRARVHVIGPVGNDFIGECDVSFPHRDAVVRYVERVI